MSKTMLKTLAVVSVLTVGGAFVAHQAFAVDKTSDDQRNYGRYNKECSQMMGKGHGRHGGPGMHRGMERGGMFGMMGNYDPDRVLTADQIRTVSEAHLIKKGNPNIKVGEITQLENGNYEVKIVTLDNSLVDAIEVDKASGTPAFLKDRAMKKGGFKKGGKHGMGRYNADREFTKDEIQTLAEANLIRMGNDNVKVDGVSELKNGNYQVVIVTQDGSLVDEIEIDKASGKPVGFLKMMEMRFGKGPQDQAPQAPAQ